MNITFIGFGKVAYTLTKLIHAPNINFYTSTENRSENTLNYIDKSNVGVFDNYADALRIADIVVSAVTPAQAVNVSRKYCRYINGIYLDLNNISPDSIMKIDENINNLVDGAVIGKIDSQNPTLYLSGHNADDLVFLNDFLNVKIISENVGDASGLKLLRSMYTKSLSALLIETSSVADNLGLTDEFYNILSLTEGDDFKEKSLSRIDNTFMSSERKIEELKEIIDYFDGQDLEIIKASLNKLKRL